MDSSSPAYYYEDAARRRSWILISKSLLPLIELNFNVYEHIRIC